MAGENTLHAKVLTPEGEVFDGDVEQLSTRTAVGEIGILANHVPVLARLLRPGGVLCVVEHGLSPDAGVARWQRRLDPLQRRIAGGCHLSRDVPALVAAAGFEITMLRADQLPGPAVSRPWTYGFLLTAT